MKDLEILLDNKPGTLGFLGEILGQNNISIEGGGVFQLGNVSVAHFLVRQAELANEVLSREGIHVVKISEVIVQKLRQDVPGQLGMLCNKFADSKVNILVQYSDHSNQLIIVPDDYEKAKQLSKEWMKEWWN